MLAPAPSIRWLGLVTPLYARIGRKLILGLGDETTVRDARALQDFSVQPRPVAEAIARASEYEDQVWAESRWSDAISSHGRPPARGDAHYGTRRLDVRKIRVDCPPEFAFQPIQAIGDTIDWWRVEDLDPPRLLRLAAEMSAPGQAWLQFEVEPDGDGSIIHQTAIFDPAGIAGLAYWYAVAPFHGFIFPGILRGIARRARSQYLQASKVTASE